MMDVRSRAAESLKSHAGHLRKTDLHLSDIDDVLDIFEDIGFYLYGDQLTPEVAHHSFHY
jgi:hypothetical protein